MFEYLNEFVLHDQLCNCNMPNQQMKYCVFEVNYKQIWGWAIGLIYLKHVFVNCMSLGMGRYEKYVDRDVANAKPYRIRDSAF